MTRIRFIISTLSLLIFSVWSVTAQNECAVDVSGIIERVSNECATIGENEVCYGNRNVNATPRINTIDFTFDSPGDLADLYNIQSLVVDSIDPETDEWGVAQMRLLVGSNSGLQDVTMLLFGEFDIENSVEDRTTIDLQVTTREKNIYIIPDASSTLVGVALSGTVITASARTVDSSWFLIEDPETRLTGWIDANGVTNTSDTLTTGILPIQDPDTPFFGAMQAFYFENGQTDIGCDTVESDGLLIQTPEGEARISLLINEVSIELVGGTDASGTNQRGSALIQANPLAGQEMNVNVLQGQASVRTEEGTSEVTSGQRTTIPLSANFRAPEGAPSEPVASNQSASVEALLPAVQSINLGGNNTAAADDNASNTTNTGSNGNNGSNNGSNNSSDTGGVITLGGGNGNGGSGNGSNGSSNGSVNVEVTTGNSNGNTSPEDLGQNLPLGGNDDEPEQANFQGFGQQGNIIALTIAIGAMIIFILWMVRNARQQ